MKTTNKAISVSVVVTEASSTRVSVSGPVGPDYSSGCGVPPVGSSWSPGGIHNAAPATSGLHISMSDGNGVVKI